MPDVMLVKLSALASSPYNAVNITNAQIASTVVDDGAAVKLVQGPLGLLVNGITNVGCICSDYSGNTYISDPTQHIIVKVTESGKVNIIAGVTGTSGRNGTQQRVPIGATRGPSGNMGPAKFDTPTGICCDKSGNIYVADYGNNQIRKITPDGYVDVVAGNGDGTAGHVNAALDPFQSMFSSPTGIAVDNSGILYVSDTGNHAIRRIGCGNRINASNAGGIVMTIAGGAQGNDDNCRATSVGGANAIFNTPTGIAVDANGNIFVLDSQNRKIKKIGFSQKGMASVSDPSFKVAQGTSWVYLHSGAGTVGRSLGRTAGKPIGSPMDIDTAAYSCTYGAFPYGGISVDRFGYLYVIDSGNRGTERLLKIDPNGVPSVICDFTQATDYRVYLLGVTVTPAQKVLVTITAAQV